MIEKIQRVPLREIWKHKARDFTVWLQNNLDVINEAVRLTFINHPICVKNWMRKS